MKSSVGSLGDKDLKNNPEIRAKRQKKRENKREDKIRGAV